MPQILNVTIQYDLPDWCASHRFETERCIYFPPDHPWGGQVDRTVVENMMFEGLFEIPGMRKVCLHPGACWCEVEFEYTPQLVKVIDATGHKIDRYLSHFRESDL